jgi:hypothetical protein
MNLTFTFACFNQFRDTPFRLLPLFLVTFSQALNALVCWLQELVLHLRISTLCIKERSASSIWHFTPLCRLFYIEKIENIAPWDQQIAGPPVSTYGVLAFVTRHAVFGSLKQQE